MEGSITASTLTQLSKGVQKILLFDYAYFIQKKPEMHVMWAHYICSMNASEGMLDTFIPFHTNHYYRVDVIMICAICLWPQNTFTKAIYL